MSHHIYTLEYVPEYLDRQSPIIPALEKLALQYGVTSVYNTFDSIETFEANISTLLYEDRNFKDYNVIYLILGGSGNEVNIDNYYYSFEEIAEFFEGKLKGKVIHLANTYLLDLEEETFQYFLDVTGAKALSGYAQRVPILSVQLDVLYFSLAEEEDDIVALTEMLFEKQYTMCQTLGFRVYY